MINRAIKAAIEQSRQHFPVIGILGPRQSGKTTLARHLFKDFTYANLEDPNLRKYAQEHPSEFLEEGKGKLIIDEVQYVPELFSYIQVAVDEKDFQGKKDCQFVLTGSQNFLLSKKISQSLAGRIKNYHLLPFALKELLDAKKGCEKNECIFTGGYPKLYQGIKPSEWFPDYIKSYVERDIRDLLSIRNIEQFRTFMMICASRVGQEVNFEAIGNEVGIKGMTVKAWLAVLKQSYVLYTLSPYFRNFGKRIVKSPKMYFFDTGVLCYLLGITDAKMLGRHPLYGSIFENYIITEMLKNKYNEGETPYYYFWKNSNGREVDLVYEEAGKLHAIEIKSASIHRAHFHENIRYLKEQVTDCHMEGKVVYGGDLHIPGEDVFFPWRKAAELK